MATTDGQEWRSGAESARAAPSTAEATLPRVPAPPLRESADLRRVLAGGRWALLAAELAALLLYVGAVPAATLYRLGILVLAYNGLAIAARAGSGRRGYAPVLLLIADLALVSALTYATGGMHSTSSALFYLIIVAAALLYGSAGAALALAGAGAALLAMGPGGPLQPDPVRQSPWAQWVGLAIVAGPAAVLIGLLRREFCRRFQAETAGQRLLYDQRLLRREMQVAREVQQAILPHRVPEVPGWEIGVAFHPAREVGGDYYYFATGEGRLVALIADAAGHNIPAALVAALVSRHAPEAAGGGDLGMLLGRWNRSLSESMPPDMFVTAICCVLDTETGQVRLANAGHPPAIYCRPGGGTTLLPPTGLALGLVPTSCFEETRIHLEPGHCLVLYTDGVIEAALQGGERLESEGLARVVCERSDETAQETAEAVMARLWRAYELNDDATILVIRRLPDHRRALS